MIESFRTSLAVTLAVAALAAPAAAQTPALTFDGPPPPAPPATVARDGQGRATIRAVALASPLDIDGRLDEAIYESVPAISGFTQIEPVAGAPASERTEVWLAYDGEAVYVSLRLWESDPSRVVATEMRRDNTTIWNGDDVVAFVLDTYYDRRNSVFFSVNAIGGRQDAQVTNETQWNGDWNPVWDVEVGQFDGGWTIETAIPFRSLRYRPGEAQVWGFNVLRTNRWKNELSFLMPMPAARGQRGLLMASLGATVVGLEAPASGLRNLEIKPYLTSSLASDLSVDPAVVNDLDRNVGFDLKYSITDNVTADVTINTDFAQVEADEQQVNLTRFSLFFPEKREFFLENQGTFTFGGAGAGSTPVLFYSRQIGLQQGRVVPVDGGGRLTGRVGRVSFGALSIRTDEEPVSNVEPTTFSVLRVKRDLLRRSSIGFIATARSVARDGTGSNEAYGVDGTFAFFDNLSINTYWARTRTAGLADDDTSYRAHLSYAGDRYGVELERLRVGDHFNPEVGFLRRDDIRRSTATLRFSPRPLAIESIRKFSWSGSVDYLENGAGRVEARDWSGEFAIEFESSDRFSVTYANLYDFLPRPFSIASGVTLPVGGYDFSNLRADFSLGRQRAVTANFSVEHGTFYTGHKTSVRISRGRIGVASRLSLEPSLSANWVDLAEGTFTTHVVGSRVTYTVSPTMFTSALVQYDSSRRASLANVRLRWEYQPGSELFVVYNETRDTRAPGFPDLQNRALIVKINRLFRL